MGMQGEEKNVRSSEPREKKKEEEEEE